MACERFRNALADVAAGGPAAAAVEAHLAACEACRAELETLRRALAAADAELAGLLAAEPTPALAVRIRRAVTEPEPSAALRFGWLWPAVAVAATLLVALVVVTGRGTPPTSGPRVAVDAARPEATGSTPMAERPGEPVIPSHDRRNAGRLERGPSHPEEPDHAMRRGARNLGGSAGTRPPEVPRDDNVASRSRSAGRRAIPAGPEVLVPPGQTETLLRFVALVYRDRQAPASLAATGQPSADLAELTPLDIPPLEIVPLDPAENSGT